MRTLPILANFKGVIDIKVDCTIIINKPFPGSVRTSCQESRRSDLWWHDVNIRLLLRCKGTKHGACVVDHEEAVHAASCFPHIVDTSETRHDVVPHSEHKFELVVTTFFERESVTPGLVGGGEGKWKLQFLSSLSPDS